MFFQKSKSKRDLEIEKIFDKRKVPILTLDDKWYNLFAGYDKPIGIREIEDKLNQLIKRQGKLTNDMKDLKVLKKKLMQDIIDHMDVNDAAAGVAKAKKMNQNQRMIKEISEKMKVAEDEIFEIPYQIKAMNEQLIIESTKECYRRINSNNQQVTEIAKWIDNVRNELKEKMLMKQDLEMKNTEIYSYLHDMLGPELIQQLDDNLKEKVK